MRALGDTGGALPLCRPERRDQPLGVGDRPIDLRSRRGEGETERRQDSLDPGGQQRRLLGRFDRNEHLATVATVRVAERPFTPEELGEAEEDGARDRDRARHLLVGRRRARRSERVDVDEEHPAVCDVPIGR